MACRRSGKQSAAQHLPANAHTCCRPHRHAQTALLEQRINDGLALSRRASQGAAGLQRRRACRQHDQRGRGYAQVRSALPRTPAASLRQRPVLEPASTSTRENAEFVLSQLRRESPRIRELYVVTNRFHQARACATFRRVASVSSSRVAVRCAHTPPSNRGAPRHAIACPARDPEPLELSLVLVREMAATLTYWAIGWV